MQKPPMGDYAAWQNYWREEGKRNRDKCDRVAEIIRAMKTCAENEFDNLALALRAVSTDDATGTIEAIRVGRGDGKYNGTSKGDKKWK